MSRHNGIALEDELRKVEDSIVKRWCSTNEELKRQQEAGISSLKVINEVYLNFWGSYTVVQLVGPCSIRVIGISKCNPGDEYDPWFGARLAWKRAMEDYIAVCRGEKTGSREIRVDLATGTLVFDSLQPNLVETGYAKT